MNQQDGHNPIDDSNRGANSFSQMAMRDGLKIGMFFILQCVAMLLYQLGIFASLLFIASIIAVPIIIYRIGVKLRDEHRGGYIRYMQAVGYLSWSYTFAMIVAFLGFYLTSRQLFSDPIFTSMMEDSLELFKELSKQSGSDSTEALSALSSITPLRFAGTMTMNALFNGLIYIYIIGLFLKSKKIQ